MIVVGGAAVVSLLKSIMPVTGGANAVQPIADLRDRFEIAGFGGDVGLGQGRRLDEQG